MAVSTGWASAHARRRVVAVLAMAGVVLTGACTSDPGAAPDTTSVATDGPATTVGTSPPATTPDLLTSMDPLVIDAAISDPTQVEAAKDLLRAQQAAHRAAMEPVNPEDRDVATWFKGDALTAEKSGLQKYVRDGVASDVPQRFVLRVVTIQAEGDDSLVVTTCLTLGARLYVVESGATIDDGYFSVNITYTLARSGDRWLVAKEVAGASRLGSDECPPA